MQPKTSNLERWQFSTSVLLPVILALVITAAAVLGFVFWSTANIDQRAAERQGTMVTQVMDTRRERMLHDLESVAIWDDALVKTGNAFDFEWVDVNLGGWLYDFFGYGHSIILDGNNKPLYMMENGQAVEASRFGELAASVMPIVERLRAAQPLPSQPGQPPVTTSSVDFALVEGVPAIVSAMTIVSDTGTLPQDAGKEPVVVAVLSLNAEAAEQLSREYQFDDGRFSLTETRDPNRAVHPILNSSGRFVAFFDWERDRPGLLMLRQTGPALTAAFGIAAILVFLLLRQLHRSSTALDAGRRSAEHQAAHDKLTGLPNRTSFDDYLTEILSAETNENTNLALYMLDLDRFKQVNDTLGHQAGDELIRSVGERLRGIVGRDVMIARLGGDEFAILQASNDKPIDVMALSASVIEAIGLPFTINSYKAYVGVSIGIVTTQGGATAPRELVRKADIALYEAKAGGRNRAMVYEEHMNELLQLQHIIEGELREALRTHNDELSVVFQPLVDQQTRKVVGAEALARWFHPKYGQISPARFIPVAENTGMIEALGDFVLRRACELGATAPGRTIAVNISPTQLRNPRFAHQVFDILHQTGMRPIDLELEITESILLDDEHISSQNLRTFRTAGIHIALDDFGTGYSSLSYLKRYPVDRIKIDRSFVSQLAQGHVSVAITQAIVTLAHAMEIEVTAEGVETEDQACILAKLGCNTLQGFLFSGGVAPDKITEIFADEANTPTRRRRTNAA